MGASVPEGFTGALVLGSIRGLRKFRLTSDAQLTGLFFRQMWTPGENVAHHHTAQTSFVYPPYFGHPFAGGWTAAATNLPAPVKENEPAGEVHTGSKFLDCKCGFYAFYSEVTRGGTSYHAEVTGVIEGYGEVVIGTKGFRALKAKIAAVHIERDIPGELLEVFVERYPGIPIFNSRQRMDEEYPTTGAEEFVTAETEEEPNEN